MTIFGSFWDNSWYVVGRNSSDRFGLQAVTNHPYDRRHSSQHYEDVSKLERVLAVFYETARLYPVVSTAESETSDICG